MMVIGITGGIGSGKSIVCTLFQSFGVPVYEADVEAKKMYDLPVVISEVKNAFGEKYFSASGELDRKKFAEFVFNDEAALKKINSIIHPHVKKNFRDWKKLHNESPYVLKEAAILFESGTDKGCDKIITVTAPAALRIQRVLERDKRSKAQIEKIIQKQWSDEEKIKRSDFVIVNDETKLVLPQVLRIHEMLLKQNDKSIQELG
ncbi:MAG: dephospho-CoA kinase [Bacteroidota bacterium]